MVLSDAEYSMAVMTAFPLSFVAILSRSPFSINADILGFSQNYSYNILALSFRRALGMPRTESSLAMSQGYLNFYYMSSAISLLSSGLASQCKSGSGPQIIGPHNLPWLCPASSSRPSLVPPFASSSSSFPSPDPSWCFYFFLFFSSSIKGGHPLIHNRY